MKVYVFPIPINLTYLRLQHTVTVWQSLDGLESLQTLILFGLHKYLTDPDISALPRSLTHLHLQLRAREGWDDTLPDMVMCLSINGWLDFPPNLRYLFLSLPSNDSG